MMRFIAGFLLVACCFMGAAVQAEERKDDWQDSSFNFTAIRSVAVAYTVESTEPQEEEINKEKIRDLVTRTVLRAKDLHVRIISQEDLEDDVGSYAQVDIKQLRRTNPEKYAAIMREWTPQLVDAILKVDVRQFGYTKVFVPAHYESYMDYKSMYISIPYFDKDGKMHHESQRIEVPVERIRMNPDHYDTFAHAGVEMSLFTAKNQQRVWRFLDLRDAGSDKVPFEMAERIFARGVEQIKKVLK